MLAPLSTPLGRIICVGYKYSGFIWDMPLSGSKTAVLEHAIFAEAEISGACEDYVIEQALSLPP